MLTTLGVINGKEDGSYFDPTGNVTHTGGKEGTYPGTRASATMIGDDETNWGTKSLAILDMPFTAVMDTLLLPWDVFRKDSSVRSRVEKSEANAQATNAVIPPARMPDN